MIFGVIAIAVWICYVFIYRTINKQSFSVLKALFPLMIFSVLVTVDLGVNYLAGAIPSLNDGIGIHGILSYQIIGESAWSIELFKNYYNISFLVSCILVLLYLIIAIIPLRPKNIEK